MSRRTILPYVKKISVGVIILVLLLLIRNLSASIVSTQQRSQIVKELEQELSDKKKEEVLLSQKLAVAKSDDFVEDEARRKLGLVKPGEKIVVDRNLEPKKPEIVPEELPNYKKWLQLFF